MNKTEITIDIVRKAIQDAAIANNGELLEQHNGNIPSEFIESAQVIQANYEQFQQFVLKRNNLLIISSLLIIVNYNVLVVLW